MDFVRAKREIHQLLQKWRIHSGGNCMLCLAENELEVYIRAYTTLWGTVGGCCQEPQVPPKEGATYMRQN